MKLRLPLEKLAGCIWLPRFVDKVRAHRDGVLHPDFQIPFCHPRGLDGHFFRHFGFDKTSIVPALASAADDAAAAAWFMAQPGVNGERIDAWNAAAPHIGREGHPGRETFLFMRRRLYGDHPPVAVESIFESIYYDEAGAIPGA